MKSCNYCINKIVFMIYNHITLAYKYVMILYNYIIK